MSIHRQKYFHLSQATVPRSTLHPTHYRPLSLFLIFLMLAQQVGILGTSAGSIGVLKPTEQQYVYIQTNPTIDDSWMGTRVTEKNIILSAAPVIKPTIYTINAGTYQVSDGTWILPKKPTKNTNTIEQETEFNSAPLVPVAQIPMSGFSTAPLVTPNGTPFASIGGYVSSSSSSALVNNGIISGDQSVSGNSLIAGNQAISGSLSVSGTTTLSNLITQSTQIDTLTLNGGVGTPIEILGRDGSGSVNSVGVGAGLSLSGGVLSIVSAVLSVTTDGVSEGFTNLYFTDARAQNALSGTIATINTSLSGVTADISTIFSDISTLSGGLVTTNSNLATAIGDIATLSGNLFTTNGNLSLLSSDVSTISGSLATTISNLTTTNSNLLTLSGNLSTLTSTVGNLGTNLTSLSGVVAMNSSNIATNSADITTLSGTVATLAGASHAALTLATTNGLSLVGQQLSLALASSTTTGALSSIDWNTFNNKINLTSLSAGSGVTYNNTTGLFGWNGTTTDVAEGSNLYFTNARADGRVTTLFSGLFNTRLATKTTTDVTEGTNLYYTQARFDTAFGAKTTDNLTEGLTNLYFTDLRAQNALSGTIATLNSSLSGITTNITSLSGSLATTNSNLSTLTTNLNTLSGTVAGHTTSLLTLTTNLSTVSGSLATTIANLATTDSNLATAIGNITTLSGILSTTNSNLTSLTSTVGTISGNLFTTNSNLSLLTTDFNTLSGTVVGNTANIATNTADITTLSGTVATLAGASHAALTLATTNGLSLVGQQLSLALASTTTTGALSATDWNTFNEKENTLTFNNGLSRIGNTVGIGTLTGGILSGFTSGQLVFGSPTGGLTQSGGLFWDDTNGRLGIGTITPTMALQVNGNSIMGNGGINYIPAAPLNLLNSAPGVIKTQLTLINTGGGGGAGSAIDFYTYDVAGGANPELRIAAIDDNNYSSHFSIGTKNPGAAGNTLTERFRITSIGNVGIGTTTPNSKFEINSGLSGTGGLRFTNLTSANTPNTGNGKFLSVNAQGDVILTNISNALSLSEPNGLILSGTQLGITLASSTTTGALSQVDWNTFNNKINLTSLSAGSGVTYNNTTGLFGWNGTTSNVAEGSNLYYTQGRFDTAFGAKTTDNLIEGVSNLYFTDARTQNALSGTIATLNSSLSGITTNITSLSGSLFTTNSNLSSLTSTVGTLGTNLTALSGGLATTNSNLATAIGNIATLSGILFTTNSNLSSLTSTVGTLSGLLATTNSNLSVLTTDFNTLSGTVVGNTSAIAMNAGNITTLSGLLSTTNSNLTTTNSNLATATGNIFTLSGLLSTTNSNLTSLSGTVATLAGASHAALTLATTNGLSLVGQQLSLALASTTTTGALSATDWNTFNSKENTLTFNNGLSRIGNTVGIGTLTGGILSGFTSGQLVFGSPTGGLTQSGGLFWDDTNGRLGIGTTTPQSGFHFVSTNTIPGFRISGRAIDNSNDLAGGVVFGMMHNDNSGNRQMVFGRTDDIGSATTGFVRFTGGGAPVLDAITGNGLSRLKLQLGVVGDPNSGVYSADMGVNGKVGIGSTYYNNATLPTNGLAVQGSVGIGINTPGAKLDIVGNIKITDGTQGLGKILTSDATGLAIWQSLIEASGTSTGLLSATDWNTFNNKINLTSLSAGSGITYNNTTGLFGWNGTTSNVAEGTNLYYTTTRFNTDFTGRSTTNLSEGTNLYYTQGRFDTAFGAKTTDNLTEGVSNLYFTDARARSALSVTGPLTYSGATGVFGINQANTSTNGFLSSVDWNTFNTKLGSINGMTGVTQTFAIGTTGTDFNIVSAGNIHTFNLPDAGLVTRGLISTGTQILSGVKTWNALQNWNLGGNVGTGQFITFTNPGVGNIPGGFNFGLTNDSASLYAIENTADNSDYIFKLGDNAADGGDRYVFWQNAWQGPAQDKWPLVMNGQYAAFNPRFAGDVSTGSMLSSTAYMDYVNNRLGIGTITPVATLHNSGSTLFGVLVVNNLAAGGTIGTAATTVDIKTAFNINQTTANQALALPTPTDTTAGRIVYINSIGTVGFTLLGERVEAGQSRQAIWNGTAWKWIGDQDGEMVQMITKSTTETVNAIAIQNDDQLAFSVNAGETWVFDIDLNVLNNNSATPDWKADILGAAGWTCDVTMSGIEPAGTAFPQVRTTDCDNAPTLMQNTIINASATSFNVKIQGTITATTAGTVQLRWAPITAANLTVLAGSKLEAYKIRGADLAEVYYTDDATLSEGHIVALAGNGISQVAKTARAYDNKSLGVISTKPGMVIGDTDGIGRPVIVGLAGRVPVKVDNSNGDIVAGDYITTSSTPGIGMRATEAGRVIGKALTGLSGESEGTVIVFIENTYYDGIDESDYQNTLMNASGSQVLDRFSYMVQKSLAKIDTIAPKTGTGETDMANLLANIETLTSSLGAMISTLGGVQSEIHSLSGTLDIFSGSLFSLSGRVGALESDASTQVTVEPSDSTGILSSFMRVLEKLFVEIETVFNEIVTFVKSVTFQSDVVFEERVVFEDADMAGTAIILAGANSVRVDFARPYASIPVVTMSADAFVTYRVTDKGVTGFTIETQSNVSTDTRFDWMALMVTGSSVTSSTSSSPELTPVEPTPVEPTPTEATPEEVVEETPVEEVIPPVVSESAEESTPEVIPEESVTEEATENVTTEEAIDEVITETIPTEESTPDVPVEDVTTVEDTPTESAPEAPIEVPTVSGE